MKKFDNYSAALKTLSQSKSQDLENEFVLVALSPSSRCNSSSDGSS